MNEEQFDLELLISDKVIQEKIEQVAAQLEKDYQGKSLVIIMVMKGAICFVADLIRKLSIPFELEYVHASSYGKRGTVPGEVQLQEINNLNLEKKDVLIVDDIFDTGRTLEKVLGAIEKENPSSLKSLLLLSKKMEREIKLVPEYILFDIENEFVVGYGLDYKEYLRGLPGIYILHQ